MSAAILDKGQLWRVETGDCLAMLRTLPDASVQMCATSPPYWNLRDYGTPGQLGLEKRHDCNGWATGKRCGECYVCRLTAVFAEVRRVLRPDGLLFLNLGDSYAGGKSAGDSTITGFNDRYFGRETAGDKQRAIADSKPGRSRAAGLKDKDLCGVPWRVALSLQADGYYLRDEIIWSKSNPMPSSVKDRTTRAHEQIFLLSKSPRYFYDADAIREAWADERNGDPGPAISKYEEIGQSRYSDRDSTAPKTPGRNKRSVWNINPAPYPDAHFATWPPCLVRPMIRAGCPVGGIVLDCFAGSGTTGMVALEEGRRFVGLELNPAYVKLATRRIGGAKLPLDFGESEGHHHVP